MTTDPNRLQPWHEVQDEAKLADLTASMTTNGWTGAPIVTIPSPDYGWGVGDPIAITGSHRIAAARDAGIDVPTIDLDELLAAHGTSLAALDEKYSVDKGDERHEDAVTRLAAHLPADVVNHYGLDAH